MHTVYPNAVDPIEPVAGQMRPKEVGLPRQTLARHPGAERWLVWRAQAGDRQAFDALRCLHGGQLRRFLAQRVAESDVEDIAQETWLGAWRAMSRFTGRCQFRTWLYTIAIYRCASHHRRGSTPSPLSDATDTEVGYLDCAFERCELRAVLRQTLSELPDCQREVLQLYYFQELNLKEISEVLDRNLNTVKYQFYRGQEGAANLLRESFAEPSVRAGSLKPKPSETSEEFTHPSNFCRSNSD